MKRIKLSLALLLMAGVVSNCKKDAPDTATPAITVVSSNVAVTQVANETVYTKTLVVGSDYVVQANSQTEVGKSDLKVEYTLGEQGQVNGRYQQLFHVTLKAKGINPLNKITLFNGKTTLDFEWEKPK